MFVSTTRVHTVCLIKFEVYIKINDSEFNGRIRTQNNLSKVEQQPDVNKVECHGWKCKVLHWLMSGSVRASSTFRIPENWIQALESCWKYLYPNQKVIDNIFFKNRSMVFGWKIFHPLFAGQTTSGHRVQFWVLKVKRDFDTLEDIPEQTLGCPGALKTPYEGILKVPGMLSF